MQLSPIVPGPETAPDAADVAALARLWERAGLVRPWNDPETDIRFAAAGPASTILVGREDGAVVASVMVGHDGHRGTVYYLAVDPDHQGKGLGRALMSAAEAWLRDRGVWKLNLLVRTENHRVTGFYEAIGYTEEKRVAFAKRLD